MWTGEGWTRTQRVLGVVGFVVAATADSATNITVPVAVYTVLGGLLGLDVLLEALEKMRR